MSVNHQSTIIDDHRTDLLEVLRVSDLLLTELCGEDVLDQRTKQEILAGGIQYEINGRFMDWLKRSQPSTLTVCLEKLRCDQQGHIANLLDGTPGERPLTREKRQQIQKNIRHLSELIDVDTGLLVLLYSMGAISAIEQQELNSERAKQLKAMKLLQVILQKSDRTLKCFVDALRETNQAHVISTLEKGNIIALHTEFRSASDLLDQFEEDLINILEPLAQQVSFLDSEADPAEEVQPIIHELQEICHKRIRILGLKTGKSINIYFWCEGVKAMAELFVMFETGHLEHILEKIFTLVKTSVKISNVKIRVTLAADDLQILKEAFQLNELAQTKPQITEKDSFPETRVLVKEEMKPPSSQIKTDDEAELGVAVEFHMKKREHSLDKTEPEGEVFELQMSAEMVASENIILKEKLEAIEQENSKLKQQLQRMQNENTVLRKQLEKANYERDQIQERYDEVLREKFEQRREQFGSMLLENIDIESHAVFGVTYLRDCIYLLSTQHIMAYEKHFPYRRNILCDISISEIKGPEDIASCHATSSLYITDQRASCVWRIIVDEQKTYKWLLEVGEPFSISVTIDDRVLTPRSKPEPCRNIYNARADLLNHFLLPDASWQPLHAVETTNKNFMLSFCSGGIMDEYGICETIMIRAYVLDLSP